MPVKIHGKVLVFRGPFGFYSNDMNAAFGKGFVSIFEYIGSLGGVVWGDLVTDINNLWILYCTENGSFYRCNGVIFISKIGH